MKDHRRCRRRGRCLTAGAVLFLIAVSGFPAQTQQPELVQQCVDFSDWADRRVLNPEFEKEGFLFRSVRGGGQLIETATRHEPGLRVVRTGLSIRFPKLTSRVVLHTVSYHSDPLRISAHGPDGTPGRPVTAPSYPQDAVHKVEITGREIAGVVIEGGQDEGLLLRVSIDTERERPIGETIIRAVRPAQGTPGSVITITVSGANFVPGLRVVIPEGIETRYTELIGPEELRAELEIAPHARPGPRPVQVFIGERLAAELGQAFDVASRRPLPDLVLLDARAEAVEKPDQVIVSARVKNVGDSPAPPTAVSVRDRSRPGGWHGEADVHALGIGESAVVAIRLEIPVQPIGRSVPLIVAVDLANEIGEHSEDNNAQIIRIPPRIPLYLVVIIGAGVVLALLTPIIRHTIKVQRRREWQEKADEAELPETCQPCTRRCRKIEIELEGGPRKITHLTLVKHVPGSDEKSRERKVIGKTVDRLNKAIRVSRRRRKPEKARRLVSPVVAALVQHITNWLRPETAPHDVFVGAHLAGAKVPFQFILYHCRRVGDANVWVEKDRWKATVADERDEPVAAIRSLDAAEPKMAERVTPELTRSLMEFVEKV